MMQSCLLALIVGSCCSRQTWHHSDLPRTHSAGLAQQLSNGRKSGLLSTLELTVYRFVRSWLENITWHRT